MPVYESEGCSTALPSEMLACPVCGNPATQKVSAIWESGTVSTHAQGSMVGVARENDGGTLAGGDVTSSISISQTSIASRLFPPPRPYAAGFDFLIGVFVGMMIFMSFIPAAMFLSTLIMSGSWEWPGFLGAAFLIGGGMFVRFIEHRRAMTDAKWAAEAMPYWQQSVTIWKRLVYCGRCDHVYDPLTRNAATSSQMPTLFDQPGVQAAVLRLQNRPQYARRKKIFYSMLFILWFGSSVSEAAHQYACGHIWQMIFGLIRSLMAPYYIYLAMKDREAKIQQGIYRRLLKSKPGQQYRPSEMIDATS